MAIPPFGTPPTPDASSTKRGKVQLAGDLSGTAASPTVLTSNGVTIVTTSGTQTLTNKTLTTPQINGLDVAYANKTANYTMTATDTVVTADATAGAFTVTLPASASSTGLVYFIKKTDSSANTVTVDGNASETIDGNTTFALTQQNQVLTITSDGTNWRILNNNIGTSSFVSNETPGGAINGSNTAYTTASSYQTGSLKVYLNGQRLIGGGADYTETASGFTMAYAPATGDLLRVDYAIYNSAYNVGTNSIISDETPSGSVNGSNTAFTTARAYIAGTLEVFINGVKQARTTHYTETTPSSGSFTMSDAPATGDVVRVNYQYNLNPSGNSDTVDGIHANTTATANQLYPLNASSVYPWSVLPAGAVVQVVDVLTSAYSSGTTTIPRDDTIPQNTEGTEFMTLAITPKSTTNRLVVEALIHTGSSNANSITAALFQDSTANALAAGGEYVDTATAAVQISLYYSMTAGTTSATTFKVRVGPHSAGTVYFNGNGARLYGGTTQSIMRITEIKA